MPKEGGRKLLDVTDVFMTWIVVIHGYTLTSKLITDIANTYSFFVCQSYLSKVVWGKKKEEGAGGRGGERKRRTVEFRVFR